MENCLELLLRQLAGTQKWLTESANDKYICVFTSIARSLAKKDVRGTTCGREALEGERGAKNSSRLAWAEGRLHEGPQSRLCVRFVSLHCLPWAGRRRAATASAVIPRGERLDTRSCEKGPAPRHEWTRGLTALTNTPHPTSHMHKNPELASRTFFLTHFVSLKTNVD